jgi:two-component system alkaline phosphatase synthesis response regulator PhoP
MGEKKFDILLIDENKTHRDRLGQRLRGRGYDVTIGTGGFHACNLLENEDFNLIILVGNMFDMPGIEFMSLVRTEYGNDDLPIILLGTSTKSKDILDSLSNGANEYVVQSDNVATLLKKVENFAGF